MAVTAALSRSSLPRSSTGRFEVNSKRARHRGRGHPNKGQIVCDDYGPFVRQECSTFVTTNALIGRCRMSSYRIAGLFAEMGNRRGYRSGPNRALELRLLAIRDVF